MICVILLYIDLGFVWLEEWKSWRMKISGRMEKWEDRKNLVLPHICLVRGMEKWEDEKLFNLVREKIWKMENVVYINWLLCPSYIIYKK